MIQSLKGASFHSQSYFCMDDLKVSILPVTKPMAKLHVATMLLANNCNYNLVRYIIIITLSVANSSQE